MKITQQWIKICTQKNISQLFVKVKKSILQCDIIENCKIALILK